jgi:hypothetical protein
MWLTLFKAFLVVFLVVSVAVIIAVGVRRSRANRGNPDWTHRNTQPGHMQSLRGTMPAMPRPEWADDAKNPRRDDG